VSQVTFVNKSTVKLLDFMGDDLRILAAARVSTGKASVDVDRDKKLINYLWENQHGTPFEKVVFEFHVETPIFIARQWMRHRIGSFNEMSGRYRKLNPVFFVPEIVRLQNKEGNKQGSNGASDDQDGLSFNMKDHSFRSWELYVYLLGEGVANEQARLVLPVSIMTEFCWTVNLRSLFNFLQLRMDSHAQPEIQQPANDIAEIVKTIVPWAWEAFERHNLKKE
jgi:thymidylate synthase (FAD)